MPPSPRRIITFSRGWRDTLATGGAAALLALFWWLSVTASLEKSHTSDELPHITAGYAFDRFGDFRLHPENGVLPQRLFGLPLLLNDARFPMDAELWHRSNYWLLGWDFFYANSNLTDWIVLQARAVNGFLGVALGLLIFTIARARYGRSGGLIALGFYTFAPNLLAHAGFATSDLAAALFLPLAAVTFWRHLDRRDSPSGLIAGLVSGLALAAKFNGVLLLPIYILLCLIDAVGFRRHSGSAARRFSSNLCLATVQGVAAVLMIWAFFDFRYSPRGAGMPEITTYFFDWSDMLSGLGWKGDLIEILRSLHVLPEAWLYGFTNVLAGEAGRPAFLAGEHSLHGWWQFFPTLFFTKTSIAMLLAIAVSAFCGFTRFRHSRNQASPKRDAMLPVMITALMVGAFAVTSRLNIGDRHILALYPALFILSGVMTKAAWSRSIACLLLIAHGFESINIRPHYLAFFNALSGGPTHAYRLVSDSSLDWGQDLPALRNWLSAHQAKGEPGYLGYFGSAWPPHYEVRPHIFLPSRTYIVTPPSTPYTYQAGLYCVSATVLNEIYSPHLGPWSATHERFYEKLKQRPEENYPLFNELRFSRLCKYLQTRKPDGDAGYSILIFRLTQEEIDRALNGPVRSTHRLRIP